MNREFKKKVNSFGACVRDPEDLSMDEAPKKGNPSLSIDRAAFLLLRVKKAFKKKRQQRKDKQAAQQAAASVASQTRAFRKGPPPLLRSRTLPAIVVPGISILQAQIDPNRLSTADAFSFSSLGARLSLQPKSSRASLASDDSSLEYRRKSAGSPHNVALVSNNNNAEPYIYACDDFERHPDGTVVLRIPAPHVVAARAYRMSGSSSTSSGSTGYQSHQQQTVPSGSVASGGNVSANASCSGSFGSVGGGGGGGGTGSGSSAGSSSNTALYRLARLLNQTTKSSGRQSPVLKDDAPRRLSWERRDNVNNRIPRSSSIDSMVEAVWNDSPRPSLDVPRNSCCQQYHQQSYQLNTNFGSFSGTPINRRESLLSPSAGRRTKQNRGIAEIALPDIITRTSDPNLLSPPQTPTEKYNPSFETSNLSGFKVKSPLFKQSGKYHPQSMEFLVPQAPRQERATQNGGMILNNNNIHQQSNKMTKKQLKVAQAQLDKLTQINIHLHALFSAVEHGHLDKARTILESTDVDINSLNSDGLSPLDVAVLSNNRSMTKMLLQHGATEGSQFKTPDSLGNHLNGLLHDAENRVQDLSGADDVPQVPFSTRASFSSIIGNTGPSVTGCAGTEADKQLGLWERRVKGLRRMLLGWDQARPPDMPSGISVDVAGLNSVAVCLFEPVDGPIGTKFKIQWSSRGDFSNLVGEKEVKEWTSYQGVMGVACRIGDLTQGRRYFFRACCGNVKGWGLFRTSVPTSVVPSSWRDFDNREHRFAGRQRILDDLFTAVRLARPEDASEISLETPALQRRNPKKKTTIKQLFSAASKFQKNLRRGIYLSCILYYEDKILVTNEDFLPVIEIDETYPSCLHTDYHWLMKVACTWEDVKSLRTDMERNSTSAVHFRTKLLSAACQMQSALCITDLGQLYHKPLRDSHGTLVLSCVNAVKSQKNVSVLNSRWVPLNKIQKKVTALHEDNTINEVLICSIADQINYHQTSTFKLSRGLYLGYLKMQSSVDQIQVVVPAKTPNVLPHCKIRDNSHISHEEWEILKRDKSAQPLEFRPKSDGVSEVQQLFLESLTTAAHRLFNYMNISSDDALTHRLYDVEVIELSQDVSFLVICPPAESSCAVPGQREILLQRGDLLSLPLQAFEMIHLRTYQNGIIQKYSRLSCILELDTVVANHSHREAFSSSEVQTAKERLAKLQELSNNLNAVWKGVRWLMDTISFARDRCSVPGMTMKEILEFNCNKIDDIDDDDCNMTTKCQLLQLPQRDSKLVKSSPGRGSWPGPAASNNLNSNCYLESEHSKSEQNLGSSIMNSRYLSATSAMDVPSRKNSADSNYSQSGNSYFSAGEGGDHIMGRLPPSRSEDTLVMTKKYPPVLHRKRATTVNSSVSANSSPHLNIKSNYQGAAESLQSLSSDSESASFPLMTSTPHRSKAKSQNLHKTEMYDTDGRSRNASAEIEQTASGSYLKPTLTALQCEIKLFKEPLHITEPLSPKKTSSPDRSRRTSVRQSSDEEDAGAGFGSSSSANSNQQPGIIQVYAAYETGLANGTSLKLHVTPRTSAREVVDLVVKQLNMAVVLKGKDGPIYTADKLENFCLVAVIGARERCLRDDFKPLQLQNPWKKGRLYVRQKHDLLAAIEHSNRDAQLI